MTASASKVGTDTTAFFVNWTIGAGDQTGIEIYASLNNVDYSIVYDQLQASNSAVVLLNASVVPSGTTVWFGARTYSGTKSAKTAFSAWVPAFVGVVPTSTAHAAPSSVVASVNGGVPRVVWTDNSAFEDVFEIEARDTSVVGSPFQLVTRVNFNLTQVDLPDSFVGGKTYEIQMRARRWTGAYGNSSTSFTPYSSPVNLIVPASSAQPPAAPINLTASANIASNVHSFGLYWDDKSLDDNGFEVQEKVTGASETTWVSLGVLNAPAGISDALGLNVQNGYTAGISRDFRVRAVRGVGPFAYYSAFTNVATAAQASFDPPSDVRITAPADNGLIQLFWGDNATTEEGIEIEYRVGGTGSFIVLGTLGTTNFSRFQTAGGLGTFPPSTQVEVRLRAYKGGTSRIHTAYSNVASVTTPPMAAPTNLVATATSESNVNLTWSDNSGNELAYEVQRKLSSQSDSTYETVLFTATANATSQAVPVPTPGTSYTFRVLAVSQINQNSPLIKTAPSNAASATSRDGFNGASFGTFTFGQSSSVQVSTTTTSARTSLTATGLPAGLTFDSNTGVVSGIPSVSGLFNVVLGASFSNGWVSTGQLVLRIAAPQVAPLIAGSFANVALVSGATSSVGIAGKFSDPDTPSAVRMSTTKGNVDVILYSTLTPLTTANFLGYITRGDYNNSVFNRISTLADSGVAVLQGGQLKVGSAPIGFTSITTQAAILNEAGISNVPYTIAMAKQGGNPNSATSQFYFNLDPANITLDSAAQNGGFTVFGRVSLPTRTTIDALKGFPGGTGSPAPNDNYPITIDGNGATLPFKWPMNVNSLAEVPTTMDNTKVMVINSVSTIPASGLIAYSTSSDNAGVATAVVNGGNVGISALGVGSATITVTATDLDGATTSQTFSVVVGLASTSAATAVTSGWATLNGSANPGGQPSTAYFEYGLTPAYGTSTFSNSIGSGTALTPVSFNLAGLNTGTTYHYRLVVVSGGITHYGANQTFTTPSVTSPPAWRNFQLTPLAKAADGIRTGAAHSSWLLYYYKGTDSNVWCCYWTGTQWTQVQLTTDANVDDWFTYGTAFNLLCYKGKDNQLWAVYWSGSAWTTVQLGTNTTTTVAGDVVIDNGWNIIYYRGGDSRVWASQWNGAQWTHTSLGGTATVQGSLAVDDLYHLVYYRGSDNQLWCYSWSGTAWVQVRLTTTANVGGAVAADTGGGLAYYRSTADNSAWCTYWTGTAWSQVQLDPLAGMSTGNSIAPLSRHQVFYLTSGGQCAAEFWNGTTWGNVLLGDGGFGLTGGLSVQRSTRLAFARRADGQVVVFYYQ